MFLANGPEQSNHNWTGDKIQKEDYYDQDFAFHLNETCGNIDAYQLPRKIPVGANIFCKYQSAMTQYGIHVLDSWTLFVSLWL